MSNGQTEMEDAPPDFRLGWAVRENNNTWPWLLLTALAALFVFNVTVIGVRPSRTVASLNWERHDNMVEVGEFKTDAELAGSTDATLRDRIRPYFWGVFFLGCIVNLLLFPAVYRDEAMRSKEALSRKLKERTGGKTDLPDIIDAFRNHKGEGGVRGFLNFAVKDFGLDFVWEIAKRVFRTLTTKGG